MRRSQGLSLGHIARNLGVSKGSVSLWCEDIRLTPKQLKKLLKNKDNGMRLGQVNAASINRKRRLDVVEGFKKEGLEKVKTLNRNEFLIAGLALYLAEGAKKSRRVEFINSDPRVIRFIAKWLRVIFGIKSEEVACSVIINQIHRKREKKINNFWAEYLNIPLSQFRKMVFVKSKQNKIYENHENYFGTLRLCVLKSTYLSYRILGLIEGMMAAKVGRRSLMAKRAFHKRQSTGSIPVAGTS